MIISVALLLALFSGFFPFMNTYGNVVQYSTAYYGAMSAIERWVLAVRYAGPGFDGESGWESQARATPVNTGKQSDRRVESFYTYGNGNDSLLWSVRSSTDRIPSTWDGNVDPAFISIQNSGSRNFNALNYATTELIPLGTVGNVDSNDYYRKKSEFKLDNAKGFSLVWEFRLNPFLFGAFSWGRVDNAKLCTQNCPWSAPWDWRDDNQVVATWTIKGKYNNTEYTLLPKDATNVNQGTIGNRDTLIRKDNINIPENEGLFGPNAKVMQFGNNTHPFNSQLNTELNIVSNSEWTLKGLGDFSSILTNGDTKNSNLSFSLVNYLWSQGKNLYPFLEYEFHTTDGSKIADRFYTIQWEGKVWKYNVKLQVKKPTLQQPALGNFTIIF